eukprot:gene33582-44978_t
MQKRRASLSEEQKEQLREKERIKRQQQRANLSDENRERLNQKDRQRRVNVSDEEQSIRREKDAEQHRNKYQEQKSFILQNHHLSNNKLFLNNRRPKINENGDDEDIIVEDEDEEEEEDDSVFAAADRAKDWKAYREKRYAQSRIYKKARHAQLKDAEVKLLKAAENFTSDSDIQQLQQLATRRQQILAYGREYGKTYRQNHHRRPWWVPIQQVWDEDNPYEDGGNRQVAHSPLNNIEHFSRNLARYNGVLSISATEIDNGKGGGWERIQGPHAV